MAFVMFGGGLGMPSQSKMGNISVGGILSN